LKRKKRIQNRWRGVFLYLVVAWGPRQQARANSKHKVDMLDASEEVPYSFNLTN
jgi:hypothetical protein